MTRVCHIGFNFLPGQGLTIFYEFARHQAREGLDVIAIAPGRPGEPLFEMLDGVRVHRIPIASIGRLSLDRFRFLLQAARVLRREHVDLVHVYAFVGAGLLPLFCAGQRPTWLYDCQTSAIKPPLIGLQNWLIRVESYPFDAVTVLSEGIRRIVFGRRRRVEAIVPLGADFDRFQPCPPDPALRMELGISETDIVLTYCGSVDHNRKLHKLVDAFAVAACADDNLRLLLIGDGSELPDLKEQARKLGLQDRVTFTGFIDYREIPRYLSVTTIALAFISMDECFEHQPPTKTVEYLAQGLPVLATSTAGNRTFVRDGENGVLCGDTPALYGQAMLDLARDPALRARLAACARRSVEGFGWAEIVRRQVIPVYRNILRRPPLAR